MAIKYKGNCVYYRTEEKWAIDQYMFVVNVGNDISILMNGWSVAIDGKDKEL